MPPRDLQERTGLFAICVVKFCRTLPKTDEAREAAGQLRRAANAVRANYSRRAKGTLGESKPSGRYSKSRRRLAVGILRDVHIKNDPELIQERSLQYLREISLYGTRQYACLEVEKWKKGKVEKVASCTLRNLTTYHFSTSLLSTSPLTGSRSSISLGSSRLR